MSWETVSAFVLLVGGGLAGIWQYLKAKAPKAQDIVNDVINRLQGEGSDSVPSRLDALEHAEALSRYMESKSSTAGMEALQLVVYEIMSLKKV